MKGEWKIIFTSRESTNVRQISFSRVKLITIFSIFIIVFFVSAKYSLDFIINFSHNSTIESLRKNNELLKKKLGEMNEKVADIKNTLAKIEEKDDELRMIMGLNELNADVRDVGIGGATFEYELTDEITGTDFASDLNAYMASISKLEREVKLEHNSFEELMLTYNAKQDSIRHLPALNPLINGRITSRFAKKRLHPVLKVYRKHPGIDIAAKAGAPIYAAADGIVKLARYNGGYGNCVFIDHQYGYSTRYGHMQKILVRQGQRVKRGDKIGLVGKTGIATAPHLHYEVIYKGKNVNPKYYYFDDEELNRLVVESRQ